MVPKRRLSHHPLAPRCGGTPAISRRRGRLARFLLPRGASMPSRASPHRPRPLLVVAPPSAERGELFAGLEARGDFRVLYVASVAEAVRTLAERTVALLI